MTGHILDQDPAAPGGARDPRAEGGERRGPHALVALASFVGLVLGAMALVAGLVTLARLAQGAA